MFKLDQRPASLIVRSPLSLACVVVAVVALAPACVTMGTYDELVAEHQETKARLAETELDLAAAKKGIADEQARGRSLQDALAAEQKGAADLEGRRLALEEKLKAAEADLARTKTELTSTQGDLAQLVKDKSSLKSSVDEMRAALDELAKRKAEADRRINEYKGLLARFKALIDAGKLKVKIVDGRMVVQLQSDVLFASGSAALSKDGKQAVADVAAVLATIPERRFQVEGHTDNVPISTAQFPSNWELASARALTVVRTMVDAGLPAGRVSAASYGQEKPAAPNDTPEGKAQNRRIEIVVVPDLSALPGFEELQKVAG